MSTVTKNTYYKVSVALMVLLALTVGISFVHLGPFGVVVALAIAFAKASLIVLIFMHVKYSSRLTQMFAAVGVFWLLILFLFTLSDYVSRAWLAGA